MKAATTTAEDADRARTEARSRGGSGARILEVARLDLAFHLKRPLTWALLLMLALIAWGLSTGDMRIQSGDSEVGGTKAWITSMFAQAQLHALLSLLVHAFFVAIAFGLVVLRDDEQKVGELLHATPLTVGEYLWGKSAALAALFSLALLFQAMASAFFNHVLADAESAEFVGPFSLANYLWPAVVFSLPVIVFVGGTSLLVGTWTRKPVLVFLLPTALLLVSIFFLWEFSPAWLALEWNRFLMLVDPAGFRWLSETWLKVDQGVDFYNTQPVGLDAGFVVSRLALAGIGIASVFVAQFRLESVLRGVRAQSTRTIASPAVDRPGIGAFEPQLASPPSLLAGIVHVARAEMAELKSQPGLYLFVPLILLEVIGTFVFNEGVFDTQVLLTPGMAATGSMNTLTLCICLLLTFYTAESLERERARGLAPIYYATPARSASILLGKCVANCAIALVLLLTAFVASVILMLYQGKVEIEVAPFAIVWGGLLLPTFFVWSSFVTLAHALTRNRYGTYGVALSVLVLTGWFQMRGDMTWASNWNLWGAARWSDLALFELTGRELFWNRLGYLALAVLFFVLAVRAFPRRSVDAASLFERLRPLRILRASAMLAPFWIPPAAVLSLLAVDVRDGFQGSKAEKLAKDYRKKNVETWKDAKKPTITALECDLVLDPPARSLRSRGTFTLLNDLEEPLASFAVTRDTHWRDTRWSIDGAEVELEDRAGLVVVKPLKPLEPGTSLVLGFEFHGVFPEGATKNGGNASEFILPSGAVLTSFQPSFVPVMGFQDAVGIDPEDAPDPKVWPDDHWVGVTEGGFGNNTTMTTRITIDLPAEYQANSVGELVEDVVADGRRRVTWKSDHPVAFANVIAGKWAVKRGAGTAIYHHPEHAYNVDEMLTALDGARRHYGEWFGAFPWKELKLSQFAGHAGYAQGFPTNITFSENIGFLTESKPDAQAAFMVTAHEAAHQWWGNRCSPGRGPGGDVLSEGMAHFSVALLMEEMQGERERIAFFTKIEATYNEDRQVDSEKPLVKLTGGRPGDTTVNYDKGGWAAWMLLNHMGRERMLAGCRELIRRYEHGPDHPVLEDYLAVLREHAADVAAFDAFTQQWYCEVVVPRYVFESATKVRDGDAWLVELELANRGTSTMPVEVAAVSGSRWPEPKPATSTGPTVAAALPRTRSQSQWSESRTSTTLSAGEKQTLRIRCDFEPERLLVDPDAKVLMLERKKAERKL